MVTEVSSKTELSALATELNNETQELKTSVQNLISSLSEASDYDGINVTGAANIIKSNLDVILADLEIVATNINSYATELSKLDTNDMEFEDVIDETVIETETPVVVIPSTIPSNKPVHNTTTNNNTTTVVPPSTNTTETPVEHPKEETPSIEDVVIPGIIGSTTGVATGSPNTGDSVLTEPGVIKTEGKTSSNGRTKRSAKTNIKFGIGDKNIDISRYSNKPESGFVVTTGNMTYELCEEDFELICAIVTAESDGSYDDALAVMTTILNRCETSNWIRSHGRDPISQATAPNQFVVYQHGLYERFLNGNCSDKVKQAVLDGLAGVRNHKFCSFRSNGSTGYSNNLISPTGNRYK